MKTQKQLFLIAFIALLSFAFQSSYAQSMWSYDEGFNAGRQYKQMGRQDMFQASYDNAVSKGQTNYAQGLADGWSETRGPGDPNPNTTLPYGTPQKPKDVEIPYADTKTASITLQDIWNGIINFFLMAK